MDTKKLDTGSSDAISLLPDEVLANILSLLPTKLAASTSVFAKKWRNVFALVHNLHFDDFVLLHPEECKLEFNEIRECFRNFVDRTLALQGSSPVKNFTLNCTMAEESEMAYVGSWISNAVERGVLELDLSLNAPYEILLPSELFTSKTLVKLTLGSQNDLGNIPPGVSLPALKTLFIDSIFFIMGDLCDVLLAGCPVLEELFVRHEDYVGIPFCISSQTIKKLSIHYDTESEINFMGGMSFDTPSLVYLYYNDYALAEYREVNLPSLVEATLDLHYSKLVERPDLSGLVNGISNVETLNLSPDSVDVISRCVKHGLVLPVFNNLVSLSFGSKHKRGWKLLQHLLKQSPKLETLIIKGLDGYGRNVTIHPYQVKVLHVLNYKQTAKELKHLKTFLGEMESLELVRVEIADDVMVDDSIVLQTRRDLMMLPGVAASPKCTTEVVYFI